MNNMHFFGYFGEFMLRKTAYDEEHASSEHFSNQHKSQFGNHENFQLKSPILQKGKVLAPLKVEIRKTNKIDIKSIIPDVIDAKNEGDFRRIDDVLNRVKPHIPGNRELGKQLLQDTGMYIVFGNGEDRESIRRGCELLKKYRWMIALVWFVQIALMDKPLYPEFYLVKI